MTKNTKIALGIAALAALFIAYKKGVFGGKEEAETQEPKTTAKEAAKDVSNTSAPIVVTASSSETPQVALTTKNDSVMKMPSASNGGAVLATGGASPFFTTTM